MANRTYDLIVLIDADAPSDTRAKIVSNTTALINQHGDVKQSKDWGLHHTPYLIDHHEEATFHVFQFETGPESVEKLDRSLKLTEGVLRFRLFRSEPGDLPNSPPAFRREERAYERPPANVAATENISEEAPAPAVGDAASVSATGAEEASSADTEAAATEVGEAPAGDPAGEDLADGDAPAEQEEAAPEASAEAPASDAAPAEGE